MSEKTHTDEKILPATITRRDFIKYSGMAVIGASIVGCNIGPGGKVAVNWGFLLVDMKKCQGCMSCMLACSLTHHGVENLSLSRIQVLQNPFEAWPNDLTLVQCRQCVKPSCVAVCPTRALSYDPAYGNVTTVDITKCIGCRRCVSACSYKPSRAIWNFEERHSQKCDLCAYTPHWKEKGGPEGKQACREICPLGAIVFTKVIPDQEGDDGYNVNLRGEEWARLGYPTD